MRIHIRDISFIFCLSYHAQSSPIQQQSVTYKGTLTTLNNRTYTVSDITIGGKKRCIKLFRAPNNVDVIIPRLCYNPADYAYRINLADITEIAVPYPYALWTYKGTHCRAKRRYLLITVTTKDSNQEKSYLIEPKRRLHMYISKNSGKTLSDIPFSGFKKCTFEAVMQDSNKTDNPV